MLKARELQVERGGGRDWNTAALRTILPQTGSQDQNKSVDGRGSE